MTGDSGDQWPLALVIVTIIIVTLITYGHFLWSRLMATWNHLLRPPMVTSCEVFLWFVLRHFCNLIKLGVRTCKQVIPEDLNNLHPEWRMTYNDTFCIQIRFWKGIYLILNPPWSSSFPPGTRLSGGCGYDGLRWDADCCVGNLQTPSYHLPGAGWRIAVNVSIPRCYYMLSGPPCQLLVRLADSVPRTMEHRKV